MAEREARAFFLVSSELGSARTFSSKKTHVLCVRVCVCVCVREFVYVCVRVCACVCVSEFVLCRELRV